MKDPAKCTTFRKVRLGADRCENAFFLSQIAFFGGELLLLSLRKRLGDARGAPAGLADPRRVPERARLPRGGVRAGRARGRRRAVRFRGPRRGPRLSLLYM